MAEAESEVVQALPEKLRQERENQGLSLEAIAEKLNLSVEQISQIESVQGNIAELSPFERGYIRNYANLLDVDISPFAEEFPHGSGVGSELQPVQRYSYKLSRPIGSRKWVKKTISLLFIIAIIVLLVKSGINMDTVQQWTSSINDEAQINVPNSDNNSQLSLPPEQ